jgi:hypothetical protein
MKTARVALLLLAICGLVLIAGCARTKALAASSGNRTPITQVLHMRGLVVTMQTASAPLPNTGGGVPKVPGKGRRWLALEATTDNSTSATADMLVDHTEPYLTDAGGHPIESVFTGVGESGTVGIEGPKAMAAPLVIRRQPAQGLLPGGRIHTTAEWAVSSQEHGFKLVWNLGQPGVARFDVP